MIRSTTEKGSHDAAYRLALVVCLAVIFWARAGAPATASFTSSPSAPSMTISSATLAVPTALSASNVNCVKASSTQVRLTWSATSSTWATGYSINRSTTNGGPYSQIGTVSGQSTTTYTDTSVSFTTTYYYVARATKGSWSSSDSNQASITTPTALCV